MSPPLRHYERLAHGVEGVRLLGYLPRDVAFAIPHRHLGLVVAEEAPVYARRPSTGSAGAVLAYVDIDALEALSASTLSVFPRRTPEGAQCHLCRARIAVASDGPFASIIRTTSTFCARRGGR